MKKTLLFATLVCAALSASAQLVVDTPAMDLAWANVSTTLTAPVKKAAQKADLKDNQVIVGLYTTDDYGTNGLGLQSALTFEVASEIPAAFFSGMNNLKVDAIRFALAQACRVESVKLYTAEGSSVMPLASKAVNATCQAGWTVVEFDEPIAVDPSCVELIPSYEITTTAQSYPISTYEGSEYASFLCYGPLGQGGQVGWFDMGGDYGTVAIQLICSCDPAEGFTVLPQSYSSSTVAINQEFQPTISVLSTSEAAVNSIDYTITLGDATMSSTVEFAPAIPAGFGKGATFQPVLVAPATAGAHEVEVAITKVNGEELEKPFTAKFSQDVVSRIVPRYTIVEEFTGTGCGWCPRGWVGMGYVKEQCSDIAGVIAFHQYNSSDPMYIAGYHNPGLTGAPGCMIDRKGESEPYYGDNDEGIVKTVKRYAQDVPDVAVEVEAVYTDANLTEVAATASTEFLTDLPGSELVFVLTGDGLAGATSSWKQGNFYAQYAAQGYSASQLGISKKNDPDLYEFFSGKYSQSSVSLVFDDVMLASSWPSSTGANKVAAFSTTAVGETATSAYTLTLPTKTTLKPFLVKDKMYVTAMVLKADGSIANAARCHVSYPEGLNTVLAPAAADETTYDLSGRVAPATAKGLLIEGGKKVIR